VQQELDLHLEQHAHQEERAHLKEPGDQDDLELHERYHHHQYHHEADDCILHHRDGDEPDDDHFDGDVADPTLVDRLLIARHLSFTAFRSFGYRIRSIQFRISRLLNALGNSSSGSREKRFPFRAE
jgi:hypothetical protein